MKKAIFLVVFVIGFIGYSQGKIEEGVIKTSQKLSSDNEQMNAQLTMMGGNIITTTYFKKGKSRIEVPNPMIGDMTIITNKETNKSISYVHDSMYGKKYKKGTLDVSEEDKDKVSVEKGDVTKTILGYECQQYFVSTSIQGNEVKGELYTTEAINAYSQEMANYNGQIKGFPLYMTVNVNQMGMNMTITYEVIDIKKESISDDKFSMEIPEGYEEMKQD